MGAGATGRESAHCGASKLQHLEDALQVKLAPEEIRPVEEPYEPHPVLGHS
jgi:aryl-alcohol dehydrogenase (NADP+)